MYVEVTVNLEMDVMKILTRINWPSKMLTAGFCGENNEPPVSVTTKKFLTFEYLFRFRGRPGS